MITIENIEKRGYGAVFSEETQCYYMLVDWVDMNNIHADETVRRVFYTGNFMEYEDGNVYAGFNIIPNSGLDRNAHVAVRIS